MKQFLMGPTDSWYSVTYPRITLSSEPVESVSVTFSKQRQPKVGNSTPNDNNTP